MKMHQLDFYEFAGAIAPGTIVIVTAGFVWPDHIPGIQSFDISLGGFGLALILAYATGHLLQSVGTMLESIWWKLNGGWPSDWPLTNKGYLISDEQRMKLEERIRTRFEYADFSFESTKSPTHWSPIFRQVYASIRAAGRDDRAHIFNGNYGMFRGIASAGFLLAVLVVVVDGLQAWPLSLTFLAVGILALMRMHRFGKHYARETFVQFLLLRDREEATK